LDRPTAAAILQIQPRPVGLYVVPPSADRSYEKVLEELIASRPEVDAWMWRVSDGQMPPFPRR
jgi:hypothetical protein